MRQAGPEIRNLINEGIYNISLAATVGDRHGYGTASILVDLTPPVVTISSPLNGAVINIPDPPLNFYTDGDFVDVLLDQSLIVISSGENLPSLNPGEHLIRIEAADLAGNTAFAQNTFTINGDEPPVAHAGPDQFAEPLGTVSLNGTASTDDGQIVGYAWTQIAGIKAILDSPDQAVTEFTAPDLADDEEEILTFRLTVFDDTGHSSQDTVNVVTVRTDMDQDGDVDGSDLSDIASRPMTAHRIEAIASHFGF